MSTEQLGARSKEAVAHATSVKIAFAGVVQYLNENLGSSLTAYIAGVDKRTAARWANGTEPRDSEAERRLRAAFQVFQLIQSVESPHTVRAWFMGMNPQLNDESPAEAIADQRFKDVLAAARAFVTGG